MKTNKEFEKLDRVGVEAHRSYYIPFSDGQKVPFKNKIIDRKKSQRFLFLDGEWYIKEHKNVDSVKINERMQAKIPVPSCVQMHGYDQIQYINARYPFYVLPPYVPKENPTYHYRRSFQISDISEEYYLNFEGVDSGFYVYINGKQVGYSQISHATSEFNVSRYLRKGTNTLDVVVLKWCASSYLECQDKFRFTGIFRSVYLLKRPAAHIRDFKIETRIEEGKGVVSVRNDGDVPFEVKLGREKKRVAPTETTEFFLTKPQIWTAENPYLYSVFLLANGEKILQRVGIRSSEIDGSVYKLNGKHVKLKGVNRHESNPKTGATVTVEDVVKDLKLMKWANVNAIRTSHYPHMPEFYDLCDAFGFYVMDEADLETHGAQTREGGDEINLWVEYANFGVFEGGITDREVALYERDKNRTCVVIWSIGNESSFGKDFYRGVDYIRARDTRPVQYEGIWSIYKTEEYYTKRIDMASRMYPALSFFEEFLADERETRPLVLCEYSHAMGNSNGDLQDYWDIIHSSNRFVGGFIWEWCDHAVEGKEGFLYGGDFGEKEHDGNFCVDGLVTPDRKIKSNLRELKAVYGEKPRCDALCEEKKLESKEMVTSPEFEMDENGRLLSVNGVKFLLPLGINVERAFIDNDMKLYNPRPEIRGMSDNWDNYKNCKQIARTIKKEGGRVEIKGGMVKNTLSPILEYTLVYEFFNGGVDITLTYETPSFVTYLPRVGLEFGIAKKYQKIEYTGYGPYESYIDKHRASDYGTYTSTAKKEYFPWIKPQETGSHWGSTRLKLENGMEITAEKSFSFSVLPYATKQIQGVKHDFEMPKSDGTYVNLDISMSGVGTNSCGPQLAVKYRCPKSGENKFRITFYG